MTQITALAKSLDKHIQNKKEQIRPRHLLPAVRTVHSTSQQGDSILPAAQTSRTRRERGAILHLCGEY